MESADKENETPNRQCLKGKHCRRAGKTRLTGSRRKDKSAEPRRTMMSTLTSFLSIIGCMSCPVASASISSTTRRKIGYRNRRQRRAAGERNIKRRLMFKSGTEYHTPVHSYDSKPKTYYNAPGPNHPKTKAAKNYDRSWYVSGTLTKPEYEIGDPVWVYSRAGWIRVTVLANQRATETGLYQLSVDNPDVVAKILGGVPVKLCLTMTEGGVHVLKRGVFEGEQWEENSDEEISFCEDTFDSSTDENSSYSEDTFCDHH